MKKTPPRIQKLWKEAVAVSKRAHAPYSKFYVGAVLDNGKQFFTGCNVENASYGATICAERTALVKAVSEGSKKFRDLVLVTHTQEGVPPCGVCLQVLNEFCPPPMNIWIATPKKIHRVIKLKNLLPEAFKKFHPLT